MIRLFVLLLSAFALSACGGGGGSATNIQSLWESPTGSGAGLVRAKSSGLNGVAIVEDVNNAGKFTDYTLVEVLSESRNADGSYDGEVVIRYADGTKANVLGRFYSAEASAYVVSSADYVAFFAGGTSPTNMPIGSYNYDGYAEVIYVYGGDEFNEIGDFEMDVQFSSKTAQLIADTVESRYIHDGLTFNSKGEITGRDGEFIVYDTDEVTELESRYIDFHGTFNGSGARYVSGVAVGGTVDNDTLSILIIAGKR